MSNELKLSLPDSDRETLAKMIRVAGRYVNNEGSLEGTVAHMLGEALDHLALLVSRGSVECGCWREHDASDRYCDLNA